MAGDGMNSAISCCLGAMGTVLGQLDKLNRSAKVLPRGISKRDLEGLIEDLKQVSNSAMDLLKEEDASFTDKCWLKEVREICYDVEDYLHTVLHNNAGVRKMKQRGLIAEDISDLRARLHVERKRRDRCELLGLRARLQRGPTDTGIDFNTDVKSVLRIPPAVLEECLKEVVDLLAFDSEEQLKVIPILGDASAGKTTVARRLYHHYGERFHCRAFLRVSRNPDTRRLLTSLLSQIKAPQHHGCCDVQELTINVNKHLRGKTYLIVVDELWATSAWDIIARAFPDDNCYSRIITTTQIEDVALTCCSFYSSNMYEMRPFSYNQPQQLLSSTIEGMEEVLSLLYNDLPDHLKTCLLYFNMYPEDYVVQKEDLVKQWVAEGFVSEVEGQEKEELAECYFDELLKRGMIQPVETNYNNEVLSCTVNQIILDLLACKSTEENFVTVVEFFDTVTGFPDNVRRLSLKFGGAEGAQIPENFRMSQVRSLLFSGFFRCMPSIQKYMLLRVLILHVWADHDKKSFNLTRISELFLLRYLKIECNIPVKLPEQMKGLQCLETLEVEARIDVFPTDIVSLQCLSHLHLPGCTEMPHGIRSMTSLRSLRYFNLNTSSGDNLVELANLTNLHDLRILCSTSLSDCLISNLASVLGKISNLRSLVLDSRDSLSKSISTDGLSCMSPAPVFLETFELPPQVCIVSSLPRWFRELSKLRVLKIALQELSSDTVNIINGLPSLASLSMYVQMAPAQRIFFNEFTVVKHFKFICPALCVAFTEGAMHTLQRLKLGFNANTMKQFSPVDAGFNHLTGLEVFSVKIGCAGADENVRGAIQFKLQDAFTQHPRRPVINIQWVDLIFGINTVQHADSRTVVPPEATTSSQKDAESSPPIQKQGVVKHGVMRDNYVGSVLGHPTPNLHDLYALGRKLGQGQFSTTYLCTEIATGVDYACKSIAKRKLITKEDIDDVRREIQIMYHLSGHKNVVAIKGAYEDQVYIHIVMELCTGGELFDQIIQRGHYSERLAAVLMRIIVGLVESCHSIGVMHRDLQPENFLLANKGDDLSLKAIDFGLSVFFKPGQVFTDVVGSPYYAAPEVLLKSYGPAADVWTAGVILYILLSGVPPFWAETQQGIFDAVLKGVIDFDSDPWPVISDSAKDLIRRMLNPRSAERLTAHEVLCHPWIRDHGVAPDRPLDPAVLSRIKQFSAMNKLKKMALRVIAESLSEEEIAGLKERFQTMDTDNSGAITYDELKEGLRKYGSTLKDTEIRDLLEAADIGNSGTIDYREFIAATMHLNKLEREEHLVAAFSYFDKDGSGYITVDELQQACKEHNMPDAFLDDVINKVDQDNDGRIDYGKFVAMMTKGNMGVGRRTMRNSLNISMGDAPDAFGDLVA